MTNQTYNGWANHATWLINVWTDGDDEIYRISQTRNGKLYDRAQELKGYVTETYLESIDSKDNLMAALLSSVLSTVDWYELVGHYEDCEVSTEDNDDE